MGNPEESGTFSPTRRSVIEDIVESAASNAVHLGLTEAEATCAALQAYSETRNDRRKSFVRGLHQGKEHLFEDREHQRLLMEAEIDRDWRNAFLNFTAASTVAYELGASIHDDYVTSGAADEFSPACQVLFLLHGRACTVASEILHLLRGGFADGANARHRTLHEIAVVADTFTRSNSDDLAERYIAYSEVERYKDMCVYQENCTDLGYEPYTINDMAGAQAAYDAALARYGSRFHRRNQWAAPLFKPGEDITIVSLERLVGIEHKRPFYMNANHQIHAGPRAALMNLRSRGIGSYIGVGARSGDDVGETAHNTLIYLLHSTACLMSRLHEIVEPNLDDILGIEAMMDLVADAGKSFQRASARLL